MKEVVYNVLTTCLLNCVRNTKQNKFSALQTAALKSCFCTYCRGEVDIQKGAKIIKSGFGSGNNNTARMRRKKKRMVRSQFGITKKEFYYPIDQPGPKTIAQGAIKHASNLFIFSVQLA